MGEKIVNIEGVGEIFLFKKKRIRNINITIESYDRVNVTVPYYVSYKQAEKFVNSKIEWIRRNQKKRERKCTNCIFRWG